DLRCATSSAARPPPHPFPTRRSSDLVARDAPGNTTPSAAVTVTVDTIAPAVSISSPPAGSTVTGNAVAVSASASDNIGVVGVQLDRKGTRLNSSHRVISYAFVCVKTE